MSVILNKAIIDVANTNHANGDVAGKCVVFDNIAPFVLIAGPCQMESRNHALYTARAIKEISDKLGISFIYKSSFDKANRASIHSKRGIGLSAALPIFQEIRETIGCPILTDIHEPEQADKVSDVADIIQVPSFLCRQTDLLIAAAKTNKIVSVKKGQFMAPWDTKNIIEKLKQTGNNNIIIVERGTCFGYNSLVNDMRSLPIIASYGCPVVFDATHSVQQPGGLGDSSGGQREFVEILSRAALAVGVAALYIEVHEDPDNAPSDGQCMVHLDKLETMLIKLKELDALTKKQMQMTV